MIIRITLLTILAFLFTKMSILRSLRLRNNTPHDTTLQHLTSNKHV